MPPCPGPPPGTGSATPSAAPARRQAVPAHAQSRRGPRACVGAVVKRGSVLPPARPGAPPSAASAAPETEPGAHGPEPALLPPPRGTWILGQDSSRDHELLLVSSLLTFSL
ncbi:unnamed protein product [Natator depressus]